MKHQALFSLKGKSKKLKRHRLQFLFGVLRVKKTSLLRHQVLSPNFTISGGLQGQTFCSSADMGDITAVTISITVMDGRLAILLPFQ